MLDLIQLFKIKLHKIAVLIALTCFVAFAQQAISSVEKTLPSLMGEERLEALIELSDYYSKTDKQKFLNYSTEAATLSEKYGDVLLSIKAISLNGDALAANNEKNKAKLVYLRAISIAERKEIEHNRAEIYGKLASLYYTTANYDSAMIWYQKALSLLKNSNNKPQLGKTYSSIAIIYWRYGANKEAHDYFTKALNIWEQLGNDSLRSRSLNSLGSVYGRWGNYARAYDYYNQALNLAKKVKDNEQISKVTINLGYIYYYLKNYDKANQNFFEARDLSLKNHYKAMVAYAELSIGMTSNQLKNYEEAIRAYGESAKLYGELNDLTSVGQALEGLGTGYLNVGKFKDAENVFKEALKVSLSVKDEYTIAQLYLSYGLMLYRRNRFEEADKTLHNALEIAERNSFVEFLKTSHKLLSQLYKSKGEIDKALMHFKEYIAIKDTANSAKAGNDIVNLQTSYAIERQEDENKILRIDNDLQQAELATLNAIIIALVVFGAVLSLGLFAFYRMTQLRKKNAERTFNSNETLKELNSKLEEQNELIARTIHTRDTLFSIIAHDLKSPFSAMLGYTEMLVEDIEEMDSEEVKTYSKHINQSAGNLFTLVNNLFEWTRSQNESIKLEPTELLVETVVKNAIETYRTLSNSKQLNTVLSLEPGCKVFADEYTFTTVLRNLYSNAIKFTPKLGTISITAQSMGGETLVSIKDSGVGMNAEQIAKLMDLDSRSSTPGTEGEKGTGLGLMVCKEFVTKNNGVLHIGSELGKGSIFTIRLPRESSIS